MKKKDNFTNKLEIAYANWVVKRRWWIIPITILTVLLFASGAKFLVFNDDSRVFFSKENPQLQALEALENTYRKNDNVIFVIAPKDGNVFTRETLSIIEELTDSLWQMPYSSRVNSITNFPHTKVEEDDLIVEDLIQDAANMSDSELEKARQIALSEPLLVDRMISPTGHVTGIIVDMLFQGKAIDENERAARFARKTQSAFQKAYPNIDIFLSGNTIFDSAFKEAAEKDMATLVPLMFLVLVLIVGFTLRSYAGTLSTLIIILVSAASALGIAGFLGIQLTPASVNAPTIILTLAVADSVHILATIFQQMRLGKSKYEAITESLRINIKPVFITSITTTIGFLSMNFSDSPPFRDLGNIVATGIMAAFIYSIMLLPALIAVLPVRVKSKKDLTETGFLEKLANFVINRRKPVFWISLAIVVVMGTGISKIELHDDWIKYFGESFRVRKASDFLEANLTGLHQIEYSLQSGEPSGINNPEYLKTVNEFANWYRKQSKVMHVNTIVETMKRLNRNMHNDDTTYHRIPESRDLAAQYLLLYEMSLPFGFDLNDQIDVDKSATRMTVTLKDATTREIREMDKNARRWLKTNAPQHMYTYGSGLTVIFAHISERNINNMLKAAFGALLLISFILMLALRNFKLGLLSLIPNIFPALIAFGVWGLFVGRIDLGLSVVASMTLGIVVDDTVHFMSKYLRARRELNLNPFNAIRYSFSTVGTALWVTTFALVTGFMVLATSGYKMNANMGLLSAITITLALVLDFLLLPVLILKSEKKSNKAIISEAEDQEQSDKAKKVAEKHI